MKRIIIVLFCVQCYTTRKHYSCQAECNCMGIFNCNNQSENWKNNDFHIEYTVKPETSSIRPRLRLKYWSLCSALCKNLTEKTTHLVWTWFCSSFVDRLHCKWALQPNYIIMIFRLSSALCYSYDIMNITAVSAINFSSYKHEQFR